MSERATGMVMAKRGANDADIVAMRGIDTVVLDSDGVLVDSPLRTAE